MSDSFQKKMSGVLATVVIGLIVISFMFSGYETMRQGTPETVAKVNGMPIKFREFKMEFDRQIQFFKQLTGGQDLSSAQIEQFKLKDSALKNLVQQKLILQEAESLGVWPSPQEIKKEIKEMPYFKTNENFDIEKYKAILANNGYTPPDFENEVGNDQKKQTIKELFDNHPVSKGYTQDVLNFKNQKISASLIQVHKNSLAKFVSVSDQEINDFLNNPENLAKVQSMFNDKKEELSKPEEITARHILLNLEEGKGDETLKKMESIKKEVTAKNFATIANKYTQDPSGKNNGGALGKFARGKMVKEFEDVAFSLPIGTISHIVKTQFGLHLILVEEKHQAQEAIFENYKKILAKEMVQKNSDEKINNLVSSITSELEVALKNRQIKTIQDLEKKYELKTSLNQAINRYEGSSSEISLTADQLKQLFSTNLSEMSVLKFDSAAGPIIASVQKFIPTEDKKDNKTEKEVPTLESEHKSITYYLSQKFLQELLKKKEESAKIKVFDVLKYQ